MALFDQALWRPSRNTPLRAARSMRSRLTLIADLGPGSARIEDWKRSMKPASRRCGQAVDAEGPSIPGCPEDVR